MIGSKEFTMSGRRTRASTRTNATNGANGRGDGGVTKPKLRTYATEDGERPVKRTRGEAATTTTTTEAKKKKPKILGKAFAAVLAAREKSKAAHVAATEAASAKANEKKGKAGKASGASAALASARAAKAAKAQAKSTTTTSTTALIVASENAKPTKGKKATVAAAAVAVPKRKYWKMVNLEGVIFSVGDSVYVVSDNTEDFDEDEDVPCTKCGEAPEPDRIMLECDTCLRGWHMSCLKPPLTEVPESDWNCPLCTRGGDTSMAVPSAASTARTACTEFMAGRLHLARIEHIWEENGEYQFAGRWYALPEETHMGRQPIQHRREVFLTHTVDINPVDCLFRVARVCTPQEFRDEEGPDAYVCEYTYDAAFQRFKRRGEWDDDEEFSDDERFDQEIDWKNDKDDGHEWNDSKKSSSNKKAIKGRLAALTARRRAEYAAAQLEIAGMGSSALGRARRHTSTVLGGVSAVLSLASTPA